MAWEWASHPRTASSLWSSPSCDRRRSRLARVGCNGLGCCSILPRSPMDSKQACQDGEDAGKEQRKRKHNQDPNDNGQADQRASNCGGSFA